MMKAERIRLNSSAIGESGPAFINPRIDRAPVNPTCSWAPSIWIRFITLDGSQVERVSPPSMPRKEALVMAPMLKACFDWLLWTKEGSVMFPYSFLGTAPLTCAAYAGRTSSRHRRSA